MSNHGFARVSGYHLAILPYAPCCYRQSPADNRTLMLEHSMTTTF